jgi:hypothetical protein
LRGQHEAKERRKNKDRKKSGKHENGLCDKGKWKKGQLFFFRTLFFLPFQHTPSTTTEATFFISWEKGGRKAGKM